MKLKAKFLLLQTKRIKVENPVDFLRFMDFFYRRLLAQRMYIRLSLANDDSPSNLSISQIKESVSKAFSLLIQTHKIWR
jgi:hypothetical protein